MPTTRRTPEDIRGAIVEAAVGVVGARGADGLTHRAVAGAAGVSLSSTTYHFTSKAAIVAAALQHVLDLDLQRLREATDLVHAALARGEVVTTGALVEMLVREVTHGERLRLQARYHLLLEAAEHPDLRPTVRTWSDAVARRTADVLRALGSTSPELDAHLLVAAADGLRLNALAAHESGTGEPLLRPALARVIAAVTHVED